METAEKSTNSGKPVCKLTWDLYMDYASQSTLKWQGQEVKISIRSFSGNGPGEQKVHFDIRYQGKDYHHGMVNTFSTGNLENDSFDIKCGKYWLEVKPEANSLEIYEHQKWTWDDYFDQVKSYVKNIGSIAGMEMNFSRITGRSKVPLPWTSPNPLSPTPAEHRITKEDNDVEIYRMASEDARTECITTKELRNVTLKILENSGFKQSKDLPQDSQSDLLKPENPQEKSTTLSDLTDQLAVLLENSGFTIVKEQQSITPPDEDSTSPIPGVSAATYNLIMRRWLKDHGFLEAMDRMDERNGNGPTDYSKLKSTTTQSTAEPQKPQPKFVTGLKLQERIQQVLEGPGFTENKDRVFEVKMFPGFAGVTGNKKEDKKAPVMKPTNSPKTFTTHLESVEQLAKMLEGSGFTVNLEPKPISDTGNDHK